MWLCEVALERLLFDRRTHDRDAAPVAPTFLYYALHYGRSVERAVAWGLDQICG